MLQFFQHDGLKLGYCDLAPQGEREHGQTVLLIHGFASLIRINWEMPGWIKAFTEAGYRVVALENRGHGVSDKPLDLASYHVERMAGDGLALLDHLGIARAFVQGYSMGARIGATLAARYPVRVIALAMGGLGIHLVDGFGLPIGIAEALESAHPEHLSEPTQIMFRTFAERNGQDLRALAACIRGSRQSMTRFEVAQMPMPVLVAVGTRDPIAGAPEPLAEILPKGRAFAIEGRDHNLAVGDRTHKAAVLDFFAQNRP